MSLLFMLAAATEEVSGLTAAGIVMMVLSVGFVLLLNIFCMLRVLLSNDENGTTHASSDEMR